MVASAIESSEVERPAKARLAQHFRAAWDRASARCQYRRLLTKLHRHGPHLLHDMGFSAEDVAATLYSNRHEIRPEWLYRDRIGF